LVKKYHKPYIVAHIAELLDLSPTDTVFEVGAESGYQAAVMSHLANSVITVESIASLVNAAQNRFIYMEINNIFVFEGNGGVGVQEQNLYYAILMSAGGSAPQISCLLILQLNFGGRIVALIGSSSN